MTRAVSRPGTAAGPGSGRFTFIGPDTQGVSISAIRYRESAVHLILSFLVDHMQFLWSGARHRITGSEVSSSNGGDATLTIESSVLRWQVSCDRKQLFLGVQPLHETRTWFDSQVVLDALTDEPLPSGQLVPQTARLIEESLDAIEAAFEEPAWAATKQRLKAAQRARSTRLFG